MNADGTNVRRLTTNSHDDFGARWAPSKRGVEVTEASVVIPNASALKPATAQEVTARARGAVVRIKTDLGSGSGFIIDPSGLILTANHVIRDAKDITVTLDDKRSFKGRVLGRDIVRDLAALKIDTSNLPTLELGDVSQVSLGSWAVVVAYPLDSVEIVITQLVTSAIRTDPGRNILWVQTDRKVNLGNSGGPLLDLQGQVIGVVSAVRENSAFAISANTVKLYLDRLKAGQVIAN